MDQNNSTYQQLIKAVPKFLQLFLNVCLILLAWKLNPLGIENRQSGLFHGCKRPKAPVFSPSWGSTREGARAHQRSFPRTISARRRPM